MLCQGKMLGAAASLACYCLLLCSGATSPTTVPSQAFPSIAAALRQHEERSLGQEILVEDGCHDVGATPLAQKHGFRLKATSSVKISQDSAGHEWNARLRGAWDLDWTPPPAGEREDDFLKNKVSGKKDDDDGMGAFQDLSLENQRSSSQPDISVCVMEVFGGNWKMTRCQIAGAGTGHLYEALILLGGELAEPPPESNVRRCHSPTLTMQECCVRALRADELALDPAPPHEVEHIIFAYGNSTLRMSDCQLSGGEFYCMHLFDFASASLLRCRISGANTAVAVEDFVSLDMRSCTLRDNEYVFHVYSPHPRASFFNNTFDGQLFEDMDRFSNTSLADSHNSYTSSTNHLRMPPAFFCEVHKEIKYMSSFDFVNHQLPAPGVACTCTSRYVLKHLRPLDREDFERLQQQWDDREKKEREKKDEEEEGS